MAKIYARQVNPEYQEPCLYLGDEFWPDDLAVFGNRDYKEHVPDVVKRVKDVLDNGELADYLADFDRYGASDYYKNRTEAIMDFLWPEGRERYSTKQIHDLCKLIAEYGYTRSRYRDDDDVLCDVLTIVTGEPWDFRTIRGCCQGDWNTVFYPVNKWSREALSAFETEYFNTGSEWIVHDEDSTPESPEDVSGYGLYCHGWDEDDIRKEIAESYGGSPEDVVLWKWTGKRYYDVYEAV